MMTEVSSFLLKPLTYNIRGEEKVCILYHFYPINVIKKKIWEKNLPRSYKREGTI